MKQKVITSLSIIALCTIPTMDTHAKWYGNFAQKINYNSGIQNCVPDNSPDTIGPKLDIHGTPLRGGMFE